MPYEAGRGKESAYPLVYFVIINWNQAKLTSECLVSLQRQDYPNFRVVIVDNGSSDDSIQALRKDFPWVSFIEAGENLGYSGGNNLGIEFALDQSADYIFLLNNDTEVDPRMLGKLVEVLGRNERTGMVGPTMYYAEPHDMIWGAVNRIDWRGARVIRKDMGKTIQRDKLDNAPTREVDYIDTCAILVKREVFESIGLMDSDYFINFDDLDMNVRARKSGFRIVYVPYAAMWHKVSAAMGIGSPSTTYYMTRNELRFFWTHTPGTLKIFASAKILIRTLRTIAAWTFYKKYHSDTFRKKRAANIYAIRDFLGGRFGKIDPKVYSILMKNWNLFQR